MAIDGANAAQAGGSLPGGTGSSVVATIIKNPRLQAECFKFRRTFQIYTAGYQFDQNLSSNITGTTTGNWFGIARSVTQAWMTPLAVLSPDMMFIFLSHAQFNALPNMTYAKSCDIKVTPLGYRLPFQTNEATAQFANSQTLVQCAYGVGINTQLNMVETGYSVDQGDLTKVTGFISVNDLDNTINGSSSEIGACMGVPRNWNNYTVLLTPNSVGGTSNCTPPLLDLISIQNVNDCKGTPLINYHYDYKNGLLKVLDATTTHQKFILEQASGAVSYVGLDNGFNVISGQIAAGELQTITAAAGVAGTNAGTFMTQDASTPLNGLGITNNNWYARRIEKSHWLSKQIGQMMTPDRPPLVHFGCMPVQSNAALATTANFSNAVIQWEIETELEVCLNYSYLQEQFPLMYLKSWDPIRKAIWNNQDNYFNNQPYISNRFPIRSDMAIK